MPKDATTEGAWESILDDCCVDRPKDPPTYRVVVCGNVQAGKRSWVRRLREAFGTIEKQDIHGSGLDYSYLDVKRSDGTVAHTVEFVCVDVPSVLDVVLPDPSYLSRCVIVFVCDISTPVQSLDSIPRWVTSINERVAALLGEATCSKLREARLALCAANRTAFASAAPVASFVNPANRTPRDTISIATVSALPSVVLATKIDMLDTLPNSKVVLAKPDEETTALAALRDSIRVASIETGSDLVFTNGVEGGNKHQEQFHRSLVGHLVNLAATPASYPSVDKFALGCELVAFKLFPCGVDSARTMAQQITLHDFKLQSVFPIDDSSQRRRTVESRYDSHQQLLAAWNAATAGSRSAAVVAAAVEETGDVEDWLGEALEEGTSR